MFLTAQDGMRIARELKDTIGHDVNIMDRQGVILASTDPKRIGQPHAAAQRILREGLPALEVRAGEPGMQEGVNLPICADGAVEGVLGITGAADEVRVFGTIAKKMAEILLASLRQQEQQALLRQARGLFLEEWLFAPEPDWEAAAARGELLGLPVSRPCRLALLERCGDRKPGGLSAAELGGVLPKLLDAALRRADGAFWTVLNRRVLVLLWGPAMDRAQPLLAALCRESADKAGVPLCGGLGAVCGGSAALRRCYAEARAAAQTAPRGGTVREYSAASLDFVLQNIAPEIKRSVVRSMLPAMSEKERQELLECLRLYFQADGNVEAAAAQACIHKNTFRYRMEKLRRATGCDLRRPRDAVMLYLLLLFQEEDGT